MENPEYIAIQQRIDELGLMSRDDFENRKDLERHGNELLNDIMTEYGLDSDQAINLIARLGEHFSRIDREFRES